MLDNKDLAISVKLKWTHALAQVAGVLLKALRDAGVDFAEEDDITLAELIVSLPKETEAAIKDLDKVGKKFWHHRVEELQKRIKRCTSQWGSLKDAVDGDVHS